MMRRIERGLKRALCAGIALALMLCAGVAEEAVTTEAAGEVPAEEVSAEVPAETPAEEVPAEVPTETPAEEVPTEVPTETPAEEVSTEVPTETPAEEVSAEVPTETPAEEVSAETPEETPAEEVPAETPEEIPAEEVPAETPEETPAEEVPAETPVKTPAEEIPAETPEETPAEEVPAEAPVETPAEEVPAEAPVEASDETPAEVPVETPVEAPAELPAEEPPSEETPAQVLTIRITSPEGLDAAGGTCRVDVAQVGDVTLEWACSAEHDGFSVIAIGPDGSQIYGAIQAEASLTLSLAGMQPGTYAVSVAALLGEATVAEARLNIELAQGEGMPEGGFPSGFPGGKPSGGFKGGGSRPGGSGQAAEAEQGFSVTAGKALTGSHDSGDGSMRLYGSVELSLREEAMTQLTLGGEALDVTLDGGAGAFTAALDGDALILTPQTDAEQWDLNGFALKTLARSGVGTLRLSLGDETVTLSTQPELCGRVYEGLCAAGCVSADYDYAVSADGVRVSVNGEDYRLSDAGELTEMATEVI